MKQQILELRSQGLSYRKIQQVLGCTKSIISYYLSESTRRKVREKTANNPKKAIYTKLQGFKYRRFGRVYEDKVRINTENFTLKSVFNKFGSSPKCYLTGDSIDWYDTSNWVFDHITAISKGGSGNLDNLGIVTKNANVMKSDMTVEELLQMCQKILVHNGYQVTK